MTSQVSTKVRLVRCPKCRKVLAELPGVPLYKCGGCGTVLQAKNRKLETDITESSSQETKELAKMRQDNVSEASSSNKALINKPEIESLSDKDNIRCQDENSDYVDLRENTSVVFSPPEIGCIQNKNSSAKADDISKHDSLGQMSKKIHSKLRDDNSEPSQGGKISGDISISGEFNPKDTKDEVNNSREHKYPESVVLEGEKDINVSQKTDYTSIRFANQNTDRHDNGSTENYMNTNVCDPRIASRSPSKESLVSFYLASSDNENQDHIPSETTLNFGSHSSLDTFGSSSLPTTTSYYPIIESYYGSEFSYDANEDQIRKRIPQASRKNKDVNNGITDTLVKKNSFRENNIANSESEWGPTSYPHHRTTMKNNNHLSRSMEFETNRYAGGNRSRLADQEGVSMLPFSSRSGPIPASYGHGFLPTRPIFKPSYPEPDRIDLMRTVCELQDQLSMMHYPQVRRFDHFLPERDMYSDTGHPRMYNRWHDRPKFYAEQFPPNYGPQVSCFCLHCCRGQDRRYSAHLPPHNSMRHNDGARNISNSPNPLNNYPSSEAAALRGYDMNHGDRIKFARPKGKYFSEKKHLRPVAGGAPVIACYHCSELLRLPADFLLFRKKYHQLMCDACRKILRFTLTEGTHIVPYVPGASAPPPAPSEADGYNITTRNTKPVPRSSPFRRVDRHVSCSEDCGDRRSVGASRSIEREYRIGETMSSGSLYEAVDNRKMKSISIETRGENESSTKWKKVNSEGEEASSSPLHRLMGYSSPSQVFDK